MLVRVLRRIAVVAIAAVLGLFTLAFSVVACARVFVVLLAPHPQIESNGSASPDTLFLAIVGGLIGVAVGAAVLALVVVLIGRRRSLRLSGEATVV